MGVSLFPADNFTLPRTETAFNHFSERLEINFDCNYLFSDSTILLAQFFPRRSLREKYPAVRSSLIIEAEQGMLHGAYLAPPVQTVNLPAYLRRVGYDVGSALPKISHQIL